MLFGEHDGRDGRFAADPADQVSEEVADRDPKSGHEGPQRKWPGRLPILVSIDSDYIRCHQASPDAPASSASGSGSGPGAS